MSQPFEYRLVQVMEKSVAKHGEKPLTNTHFLNIIKLTIKLNELEDEEFERTMDEKLMEIYASECGDRR